MANGFSAAFIRGSQTQRLHIFNEVDSDCDVSIALEAHREYAMSKTEAQEIVARTGRVVAEWRHEAGKLRIPKAEQELMEPAFETAAP